MTLEVEAIISRVVEGEGFYTFTPFSDTYLLEKRQITSARLTLDDSRRISPKQRKHIYATIRDIAAHTGYAPEEAKEWMKYLYVERMDAPYISLSDCDMTTARHFLQFLIDLCIEQGIPTRESLLARAPDIAHYIYACLLHRKCCICGGAADVHHVDTIGMGMSRKTVVHVGMRAMPLARKYHREVHDIGQDAFNDKYKVFGIELDEALCEALGLNTEAS